MKRFFKVLFFASIFIIASVSCKKSNLDGADLMTLSLSYDTDGNTLPAFDAAGGELEKSVVINQGGLKRDIDWTVSVDNNPSWISVSKTSVSKSYKGTYGGDDVTFTLKAIKINVSPNDTGIKRSAVIRFEVADGSTISTLLNQNK